MTLRGGGVWKILIISVARRFAQLGELFQGYMANMYTGLACMICYTPLTYDPSHIYV